MGKYSKSYSCIKKQQQQQQQKPVLLKFNKILDKISHDEKLGHLFVVDITFYKKILRLYYSMKFTRQSLKKPFERSTLQLMTVLNRNKEKDTINRFAYNSKTHSTLREKKFIPLCPVDLYFLIK